MRQLASIAFSLIIMLAAALASPESTAMDPLDSSRYFSDPAVAAMVDDIQRGKLARVQQHLAAGINPDAPGISGFRPIHFVFAASDAAVLKALLAGGADPKAKLDNGNTPLHFAVRMPNPDFTAVLLASGADPNARGENDKPVIHEALSSHAPEILRLLARAGADLNVVWGYETPLCAAIIIFQWPMAATLLDLNADLAYRDRAGKTAVDRFCERANRVPPNPANSSGIIQLFAAFRARGIQPPCAALEQKFK